MSISHARPRDTPYTGLLFKVLDELGRPYHGGKGKWYLPVNGRPGRPMPPIRGLLIPCQRGYHLCRAEDLVEWLGPAIYLAQYRGEMLIDYDKVVVREARLVRRLENWNRRTAQLFAADCAEHVLPIFRRVRPDDYRPQEAIAIIRRYVNGQATAKELAIARDAAESAMWACATVDIPARDAVRAVWVASKYTAWDAARAAARAAADAAIWSPAWAAERTWQTARLMEVLGLSSRTEEGDAQ